MTGISARDEAEGFTLIELIVALAVMALLAALLVPRISWRPDAAAEASDGYALIDRLERARSSALQDGVTVTLDDVRLVSASGAPELLAFSPDGSANGGRLVDTPDIIIEPITGTIVAGRSSP